MGVCYFEKIALDELDRRTIKQLKGLAGFGKRFVTSAGFGGRLVSSMGRGVWTGIKGAGRFAEWLADKAVNHPTRTLTLGVPLAYGLYKLPDRASRAINNVSPENIYRY
jgi:hypothetical protein